MVQETGSAADEWMERHCAGGRIGDTVVSVDVERQQAAYAHIRQTHDLLSAGNIAYGWHPGYLPHFNAGTPAVVSGIAARRQPVGLPNYLRCAAEARRFGAGLFVWQRNALLAIIPAWCLATTFSLGMDWSA